MRIERRIDQAIVGPIIIGIGPIVRLPGVARLIGEPHCRRQRPRTRQSHTDCQARHARVEAVLIDAVGKAAERADRRDIAQIGEDIVATDRFRTRADTVDPPDRPHAPRIADIGL